MLHLAIQESAPPETIIQLLNHGANVNAQDYAAQTALHVAIEKHAPSEIIAHLLDQRANVNTQNHMGRTALHLAIQENAPPNIIARLLDQGAAIDIQDYTVQIALDTAVILENRTNKLLILDQKLDINILESREVTWRNIQLLSQKRGINEQDHKGNTLLLHYLYFCQSRKIPVTEEILMVFLSLHSNLYLANHEGKTVANSIVEHPQLSTGLKQTILRQSALGLLFFVLDKTNPLEKIGLPNEIHQRILFYSLLPYFSASTLPKAEVHAIVHMTSTIEKLFNDNLEKEKATQPLLR